MSDPKDKVKLTKSQADALARASEKHAREAHAAFLTIASEDKSAKVKTLDGLRWLVKHDVSYKATTRLLDVKPAGGFQNAYKVARVWELAHANGLKDVAASFEQAVTPTEKGAKPASMRALAALADEVKPILVKAELLADVKTRPEQTDLERAINYVERMWNAAVKAENGEATAGKHVIPAFDARVCLVSRLTGQPVKPIFKSPKPILESTPTETPTTATVQTAAA